MARGNEKPPAALAGGGLGDANAEVPVGQAPLPARALGLVIRMTGTDAVALGPDERDALAAVGRMTLIRVEQRRGAGVKEDTPAMIDRELAEIDFFRVDQYLQNYYMTCCLPTCR